MARPTPAQLQARNTLQTVQADPEDVLAPLLTGTNPDGTPFRLPVSDVPMGGYWVETPAGLATLGAGLSLTGATRDLLGVAAGVTLPETAMAGRFRVFANATAAFTINAEASDDNAIWDPVGNPVAQVAGPNGIYLEVPVLARYMRARITNTDAAAFTSARLRTIAIDL